VEDGVGFVCCQAGGEVVEGLGWGVRSVVRMGMAVAILVQEDGEGFESFAFFDQSGDVDLAA
jgi:hypothetical protein